MADPIKKESRDHDMDGGPPIVANAPPPLLAESNRKPGVMRPLLAVLLSLCLGLFLADAVISLADDSLILFFKFHILGGFRAIVCLFAMFLGIVVYGLMGLTPMIPKCLFLPVALFYPAVQMLCLPFAIYFYNRFQLVAWSFSCCQVILGFWILFKVQDGLKFRWPLVPADRLGLRQFGWRNLLAFVLANVFGLLPVVAVYLFLCTALAVDHFSEGFMVLRPGGFSVQVRKYVRNDGKTIQLFPMAHIADEGFYQKVSQSFPSNSMILMEGVTDNKNLLTNKITYKRMAKSLGLAEQHEKFDPTQGEIVMADVDVEQFSKNTIDLLNLIMLFHSKGISAGMIMKLMEYAPDPNFENQLIDDLLKHRNQHLLAEIQDHLKDSDNLMVPWGVAHMPGIAKEIQKSGFQLGETREYTVIRFGGHENQSQNSKPTGKP